MNVRYRVELSQVEHDELKALLGGGKHAVRKVKRTQVLLAADAGASDEGIATGVGAFMKVASIEMKRALILGLHTGQREGDMALLALLALLALPKGGVYPLFQGIPLQNKCQKCQKVERRMNGN